jgi:endonuclease III
LSDSQNHLSSIVNDLRRFYGLIPEPPQDAFGFFVWHVLGERTSPVQRDAAFAALRRVPALTPDSFRKAPPARLHAALLHAGPIERRLKALTSGAEIFRRHRDIGERVRGPLLDARRATRLVAPLTTVGAQWMLLVVGGHEVVPRHHGVARLLTRLGLLPASASSPAAAKRSARALGVLRDDGVGLKRSFLYLAHHCLSACASREPHCRVCPLSSRCGSCCSSDR